MDRSAAITVRGPPATQPKALNDEWTTTISTPDSPRVLRPSTRLRCVTRVREPITVSGEIVGSGARPNEHTFPAVPETTHTADECLTTDSKPTYPRATTRRLRAFPENIKFQRTGHAGGLLIDGTTRQRYSRVSGVSYALRHRGLEHLPEASGRTLTTEEQAKLQFCRSNDF